MQNINNNKGVWKFSTLDRIEEVNFNGALERFYILYVVY